LDTSFLYIFIKHLKRVEIYVCKSMCESVSVFLRATDANISCLEKLFYYSCNYGGVPKSC